MFFYQIYDELKHVKGKNEELEKLLIKTIRITAKNQKREEALHQRVHKLEEKNKRLENALQQMVMSKEKTDQEIQHCQDTQNELYFKHNEMKIMINSIITELNYVITILNNKLEEK